MDGTRIGGDVSSNWGACQNMLTETVGCQPINNVWFQLDPDAIPLRRVHSHLRDDEVRALALWMGMNGGVINTSDPLHELDADRLALWRFLEPGPKKWEASLPFWGRQQPVEVMTRDFSGGKAWAVLMVNRGEQNLIVRHRVADLIGVEEAFVFDWGPEGSTACGRQSELLSEVAPHGSRLYYLTKANRTPAGLTLGGKKNR